MEFSYEVKVPKDRVAVLIGVKGSIKRKIQSRLKIKLEIDSKTGDVVLTGDDSLQLLIGQNIVKAIGRGFNPLVALDLLNDEYMFDSIDMTDFVGDKKNSLTRARSRCIGEEGKARKTISRLSQTKIVIFGKTVSIIGEHGNVNLARRAFEGLLQGQRHATVFSWLERNRKKLKLSMY